MKENAPFSLFKAISHLTKKKGIGFRGTNLIEWPQVSADVNQIETLQSVIKRRENGKRY